MSLSNYYENKLLQHIFGHQIFTPLAKSVGLCFSVDDSSYFEALDDFGYARVQTSTAYWSQAAAGVIINTLPIQFPLALDDWGTMAGFIITDSASWGGGNVLMWGALEPTWDIEFGSEPRFDPGDLIITFD